VRGASTETTWDCEPSRSTGAQSITMPAMSNGTWSSSSNGTAWAIARFSANGNARRRTEMRVAAQRGDHVVARNDWMLSIRASWPRASVSGSRSSRGAHDLTRCAGPGRSSDGLDRMAAEVEPEDVLQERHARPLITARAR
jgi:hypothetical protein